MNSSSLSGSLPLSLRRSLDLTGSDRIERWLLSEDASEVGWDKGRAAVLALLLLVLEDNWLFRTGLFELATHKTSFLASEERGEEAFEVVGFDVSFLGLGLQPVGLLATIDGEGIGAGESG